MSNAGKGPGRDHKGLLVHKIGTKTAALISTN
jgi:hypothetical protein